MKGAAVLIFAAEPASDGLADPAFWVNLGVAGVFLLAFFTGRLHSNREMDAMIGQYKAAIDLIVAQNAATTERMERQITQLTNERDRAYAEKDDMVDVIKDFTHTASALLPMVREARMEWRSGSSKPQPRRRSPGGDGA